MKNQVFGIFLIIVTGAASAQQRPLVQLSDTPVYQQMMDRQRQLADEQDQRRKEELLQQQLRQLQQQQQQLQQQLRK